MSKTTYITRGDVVLYALADNDFGDHDAPRHAPHYVDKKLTDWERDAKIAFGEYLAAAQIGGDWEYNGSSRWSAADPEVGMTVAVYESRIAGFHGDDLDALKAHPDTVFHGYLEFVDQGTRYSNAVVSLADLAEISSASRIDKLCIAVGDLFDESREHDDPIADIRDALRGSNWDYVAGEVVLRTSEAA